MATDLGSYLQEHDHGDVNSRILRGAIKAVLRGKITARSGMSKKSPNMIKIIIKVKILNRSVLSTQILMLANKSEMSNRIEIK